MLNHSCVANCVFSADPDGTLYVATTDTIEKGEELTVQYIEMDPEVPLDERRRALEESFYFLCRCELCQEEEDEDADSDDGSETGEETKVEREEVAVEEVVLIDSLLGRPAKRRRN